MVIAEREISIREQRRTDSLNARLEKLKERDPEAVDLARQRFNALHGVAFSEDRVGRELLWNELINRWDLLMQRNLTYQRAVPIFERLRPLPLGEYHQGIVDYNPRILVARKGSNFERDFMGYLRIKPEYLVKANDNI